MKMRFLSGKLAQSGIAAVEFLITIPAVLIILVGVTEFGTALIRYNTLNHMVQDGVRYAVTDIYGTASTDQIADISNIKNVVLYGDPNGSGTAQLDTLTADDITVTHANKFVTVSATYLYVPLLSLAVMNLDLNFELSASAVMRTAL
ncbi:TadE/TadG family type IV pilus assembly protein [Vibrio mangrovi]|uniref:TadE-like protein n=1 Tax=Vibrio mangrovi TaxID=474394 RepID=A0A1Y6J0Z7_9VIBR|nr:TadE/TadG family type IV pilus assembly protein [Vibrio mangrovi]MDW6002351.1 TadE/TadG family type IV pilus assembly protein [Vibrio mangrovi]SMS02750.1 TadE-like protein [Vibrio mangrovi]